LKAQTKNETEGKDVYGTNEMTVAKCVVYKKKTLSVLCSSNYFGCDCEQPLTEGGI